MEIPSRSAPTFGVAASSGSASNSALTRAAVDGLTALGFGSGFGFGGFGGLGLAGIGDRVTGAAGGMIAAGAGAGVNGSTGAGVAKQINSGSASGLLVSTSSSSGGLSIG
jgi:hypothetical protein